MSRRPVLWTLFVLVHAFVAWLGFALPNEPMALLGESADGRFCRTVTSYYAGWVPAEDIVGTPDSNKVEILNHAMPGPWRFRVIAVASNGKRSQPSWPATAHRNY